MQRFNPIEAVFKGRHFDGQVIMLCVTWYTSFKLSVQDLAIMVAERGYSPVGAALPPGVREALAALRSARRWIVEDGRDGSGANARVAGDDEEMQRFVPIEGLFRGRHFDRQIIFWCVSWYTLPRNRLPGRAPVRALDGRLTPRGLP